MGLGLVGDLLCFGFGLRLLMFGVGVCCLVLWWFGLLFACTVVMCTLVGGWVDLVVDCSLWLCWFIVVRLSFVACLIATVTGCGVCCLILALGLCLVWVSYVVGLILSVVIWFILLG